MPASTKGGRAIVRRTSASIAASGRMLNGSQARHCSNTQAERALSPPRRLESNSTTLGEPPHVEQIQKTEL
jgi:hypothetical protein